MLEGLIDENVQYLESTGGSLEPSTLQGVRRRDPYFDVRFIAVAKRITDVRSEDPHDPYVHVR